MHPSHRPRKMPRVTLTLRWLAAALALLFAGNAAADEVRFRLINGTEFPIRALVLSPEGMAETLGLLESIEELPDLRALVRACTTAASETSTARQA